eukprot:6465856-Amphidinium_carterae.1
MRVCKFETQTLAVKFSEKPYAHCQELGLWNCRIGDGGAYALAAALDKGCGGLESLEESLKVNTTRVACNVWVASCCKPCDVSHDVIMRHAPADAAAG